MHTIEQIEYIVATNVVNIHTHTTKKRTESERYVRYMCIMHTLCSSAQDTGQRHIHNTAVMSIGCLVKMNIIYFRMLAYTV